MNIWTGGKRLGKPTRMAIFTWSILRIGSVDGNITLSGNGSMSCITSFGTIFIGQMQSGKRTLLPIEWYEVSISGV
jgi:hypothetical protein